MLKHTDNFTYRSTPMSFAEFVNFLKDRNISPMIFNSIPGEKIDQETASADADPVFSEFFSSTFLGAECANVVYFGLTADIYRETILNAPDPFVVWVVGQIGDERARLWKVLLGKMPDGSAPLHSPSIERKDTTFERIAAKVAKRLDRSGYRPVELNGLVPTAVAFVATQVPVRET